MKPLDQFQIRQNSPERSKEEAYAPAFEMLKPPQFASIQQERQHRKQRLTGGLRILASLGLCEGVAGHITARDPEFTDTFWVNPFGMGFGDIRVSDLIRVDSLGRVVEGTGVLNIAAFAIHACIHHARSDVVAAVHCHSIYGKSWSAMGRLVEPITQDACAFFEDHVFYDDTRVLVTEMSEGNHLATALGPHKAIIMRNHGNLTVGHSVDEAVWWFICLERCCQSQFLTESIGKPLVIDAENARATRSVNGSHFAGWLQCQPFWSRIVKEQPDLLN